jgi:hypothetical protein
LVYDRKSMTTAISMAVSGFGEYRWNDDKWEKLESNTITENTCEIIQQSWGSSIAIGIRGRGKALQRAFDFFFNWGIANDPEPTILIDDEFVCFFVSRNRLVKALTNKFVSQLASPQDKGKKFGVINEARQFAQEMINSWPEQTFVRYSGYQLALSEL